MLKKKKFSKYKDECWNAILSVQAINQDEKAIPQYQALAAQTQGQFYKTEAPEQIAARLTEISSTLANRMKGESLDVVFVVDNTGSMGDSLQAVKGVMRDIVRQITEKVPNVRLGLVQYRDKGDDFVTRPTAFTADLTAYAASIEAMEAHGGGDWPEALIDGLNTAITGLEWKGKKRVIIVIGDAPGHDRSVEDGGALTFDKIIEKARARDVQINIYTLCSALKLIF